MNAVVDQLRDELDAARRGWRETGEVVLETSLSYDGEEPVRVLVRKRGRRYDISDLGRAVHKAGVRRWLPIAQETVAEHWLNVNRAGVVFVGAVEGRDLAWLAQRIAEASRALYGDLLEHAAT
jgi:hypothetical protein